MLSLTLDIYINSLFVWKKVNTTPTLFFNDFGPVGGNAEGKPKKRVTHRFFLAYVFFDRALMAEILGLASPHLTIRKECEQVCTLNALILMRRWLSIVHCDCRDRYGNVHERDGNKLNNRYLI